MMRHFLFLFLFSCALCADEPLFDLEASKETVIDQRENYFQTATSYTISPKVNPITGDLIEEEVDFVVAGSEPLSLRRFYNHTATYEPRYGGWRYNPESYLVANFEWPHQECFAAIGDFDGSVTSFKTSSTPYMWTFDIPKGFSNFHPNGQSHPLNTKLTYCKIGDPKDKYRFFWKGEIIDGKGVKRSFASGMHQWLHYVRYTEGKKTFLAPGSKKTYRVTPNVWTPYQIPIQEAKLPNGNILCYSYVRWKEDKLYPKPPLLGNIIAFNADRSKILGTITFRYNKDKHEDVHGIQVVGSDGRVASLHHHGSSPILLTAAYSPDRPTIAYGYQGSWINRVEKPEGRVITTEYDASGKVAAQNAPVGPNGEMHPIGRYIYHNGATEVLDAEGNKTVYKFNEHKQILAIETYQGEVLYSINRLDWDPDNGNLRRKTIEDGLGNSFQITEYKYDKNHNPIEEKVGDGKEWYIIKRTFSDNGFNLVLTESDRKDKMISHSYLPGTDLLTSTFIYEGAMIRQRTFHTYDDCAVCIKTIIDDGSSTDPDNLYGVSYRTITEVSPKQTMPCFGLPEVIQEKTINYLGKEISLKKIAYTYTPFGKVLTEEHHDAEGTRRYTIHNQYDEKERLISTTDALGNLTRFAYDVNDNLVSITGPKPDQHKEIAYDKANRPISIAEWQSDGSILVFKKKYDKLGRVIVEIDPCGNETCSEYDHLGRVIAIYYPDGSLECKEYDILNNILRESDAEGYITQKTYNFRGQPLAMYHSDGSQEFFTYNSTGTLSQYTDTNGAKTEYVYDLFDHPICQTTYNAAGIVLKTLQAVYSPFHKLCEIDGEGISTTYAYDFAGRKISEQRESKITQFFYDPQGLLCKTKEMAFSQIEEHDNAGQVIEKRMEADGCIQFKEKYVYNEAGERTHLFTSHGAFETMYNSRGKPLTKRDPLGFITTYEHGFGKEHIETTTNANKIQTVSIYDSRDREIERCNRNPFNEIIAKSINHYNNNGDLIERTHFVFNGADFLHTITHRWNYGPKGRIESFIESGIREIRYSYNSQGKLQTITKPSGIQLHHEWDHLGRLARYFSADFDYHYIYDRNDRLLSVRDARSKRTTTRTYNALGSITQEVLSTGFKMVNTFDLQGRRVSLILHDNSTIDYTYQGAYLYSVNRHGLVFTYSVRDLEGHFIKIDLPHQLGSINIKRDKLSRWQQCDSPYYHSQFPKQAYDPSGNLITYWYRDSLGTVDCVYQYDDLNQLISENDHSYSFDSLNNRLKKNELPYQVDTLSQILDDGCATYEYDRDGNLIFDGHWHYKYDTQDRLITLTKGSKCIEYEYDPFHRRLSKNVFIGGKQVKYERYLWDGDNEIGVVDEQGNIEQLRVLGEGLGAEIGAAVLYELKGKRYLPLHDHRGCVVSLVDIDTRTLIESYRYTAFGEELEGGILSPWRFSSKRVEEDTGLIFFGRRYYLPTLGRWITQDPQGFDDGPNLYAYLNNCPLVDIDPYGLFAWEKAISTAFNCCGLPGAVMNLFGFGQPKNYPAFEHHFSNKSYNFDLGYPALPVGEIGRTNGMSNSDTDVRWAALELSQMAGGYNIYPTYNATHGLYDFHEAAMNMRGINTEPVWEIQKRWDRYFENDCSGVPYYEECHSQGTALVKNALQDYPKERRDRIIVRAFAPSSYITKDLCGDIQHYVSDHDRVHLIDFSGRRQCADTTVVLKRHPEASRWFDHSIHSPTFTQARRDAVQEYLNKIQSYKK